VGVNSLPNPQDSNYYYAFSVGSADVPDIPVRDAFHNLEAVPELPIHSGIARCKYDAANPVDNFVKK